MHAVLALNSGKDAQGELTRETRERIDAAMNFAAFHTSANVIMVGGDADSMCGYAADHFPEGPRPTAEGGSKDTIEGAHYTKVGLLAPNDWNDIDIFTNDFHTPRTEWIFSRVLGAGYSVTMHPVATDYISLKNRRLIQKREQAQLAVARLKLAGIGPNDDTRREQRLAHFRFRDGASPMARLLTKMDRMTNITRG